MTNPAARIERRTADQIQLATARAATAWGEYAFDNFGTIHVLNPQRGWTPIRTSFRAYVAARKEYLKSLRARRAGGSL